MKYNLYARHYSNNVITFGTVSENDEAKLVGLNNDDSQILFYFTFENSWDFLDHGAPPIVKFLDTLEEEELRDYMLLYRSLAS